ncbi:MAG: two pore domain potassium channel family protein [Deltaproteobacteria bacterium]|nr:two pore domain potassium channel family protein [Deltaproteobacteria bacterium]
MILLRSTMKIDDRRHFLIFFLALIALYFAFPLLDHKPSIELVLDFAMTTVLVWALFAIGRSQLVISAAVITALPIPLARLYNLYDPFEYHEAIQYVCLFLLEGYSCAVILKRIVKSPDVSVGHIYAAVGVYLLSCFMWADAFSIMEILHPGTFTLSPNLTSMFSNFLYFSTTCLTTNSYGDVTVNRPFARALCAFIGCSGQLYVALILAYLVGMHGSSVHSKSTSQK